MPNLTYVDSKDAAIISQQNMEQNADNALDLLLKKSFLYEQRKDKNIDPDANIDEYIKAHQREYSKFYSQWSSKLQGNYLAMHKVAAFSDTSIILAKYRNKIELKTPMLDVPDSAYANAVRKSKDIVNALLNVPPTFSPVSQSGQQLHDKNIEKVIQYAKAFSGNTTFSSTAYEQDLALKKLFKDKRWIEFDLETLDSKLGDIFEYTFLDVNFSGLKGKSLYNINKVQDVVGKISAKPTNGIIGISSAKADAYQEAINLFKEGKLNPNRLHIIQSLAKIGMADQAKGIVYQDGRWLFKSYISQEAVLKPRVQDAQAGLNVLLDIGLKQTSQPLVNFDGYKVTRAEADILETLKIALDRKVVLGSQNGIMFDSPVIDAFFQNNATDGAKQWYQTHVGSMLDISGWPKVGKFLHADTMQIMRGTATPNGLTQDIADRIAQLHESPYSSRGFLAQLKQFNEFFGANGNKAKTTVSQILGDDFVAGLEQHSSLMDTVVQALGKILYANKFSPESADYLLKKSLSDPKDFVQIGDIFLFDRNVRGLERSLTFVQDKVANEIRFANNPYSLSQKTWNAVEDNIYQGLRKGEVYRVAKMGRFSDLKVSMPDELKRLYPALGGNDLVYVAFNVLKADSNKDLFRSQNLIYKVMTKSQAHQLFTHGMSYLAYSQNDTLDFSKTPKKTIQRYAMGDLSSQEDKKQWLIDVVTAADEQIQRDALTRRIREMKYSTIEQALNFLELIDKEMAATQESSAAVISRLVATNDSRLAHLSDYQFNKVTRTNAAAVDMISSSYAYFKSMRPILSDIKEHIDSLGLQPEAFGLRPDDMSLHNTYAKALFDRYTAAAYGVLGMTKPYQEVLGFSPIPRSQYAKAQQIAVDLSGMLGRNQTSIGVQPKHNIIISLDSATPFASSLRNITGSDNDVANLRQLANFLGNKIGNRRLQRLGRTSPNDGSILPAKIEGIIRSQLAYEIRRGNITTDTLGEIVSINPYEAAEIGIGVSNASQAEIDEIRRRVFSADLNIVPRGKNAKIIGQKKYVDSLTSKLTENVKRASDNEWRKELQKFGFKDYEIERKIKDLHAAEEVVNGYVTALFDIFDNNPSVTISMSNGRLLAQSYGGEQIDFTKYLPVLQYDSRTGTHYFTYGNQKISLLKDFHKIAQNVANENAGKTVIATPLYALQLELERAKRFIKYQPIRPDIDPMRQLAHFLSSRREIIAKENFIRGDLQDALMWSYYNTPGFINMAADLYKEGVYQRTGLDSRIGSVLEKLVEINAIKFDQLEQADQYTLFGGLRQLLRPFRNATTNDDLKGFFNQDDLESLEYLARHFNYNSSKHIEKHMGTSISWSSPALLGSMDPRQILSVERRALQLDFAHADEELKKVIQVGPALMSEQTAAATKNLGYIGQRWGNTFRGTYALASTEQLAKALSDANLTEHRGYKYLKEGGLLVDPRLLTLVHREQQFVRLEQEASAQLIFENLHANQLEMGRRNAEIKKKTQFLFKLNNNNDQYFFYGQGTYVNPQDKIRSLLSFDRDFTGQLVPTGVHTEGMLLRGYFDQSGNLVPEKQINSLLGAAIKSGQVTSELEARNYLENTFNLTEKMYIRALDNRGYRKMLVSAEKNMGYFLQAGIGEFDEKVKAVFEAIGLEDLIGTTPDDYFFKRRDRLAHLAAELTGRSQQRELDEAIRQHFQGDYKSFVRAISAERYQLWDTLRSQLGLSEDVIGIGGFMEEAQKPTHGASMIDAMINQIIARDYGGLDKAEAYREFASYLSSEGIIQKGEITALNAHGIRSLILSGDAQIQTEKFAQLYAARELAANPNGIFHTMILDTKFVADSDQEIIADYVNNKGIKANRRTLLNMARPRWTQYRLNEAWEHAQSVYGETAAERFNELYKGIASVVAGEDGRLNPVFDEGAYGQIMNKNLVEYHTRQMISSGTGPEGEFFFKSKNHVNAEARRLLYKEGYTKQDIEHMSKAFKKLAEENPIYADASVGYVMKAYQLESAHAALKAFDNQSVIDQMIQDRNLETYNILSPDFNTDNSFIKNTYGSMYSPRGYVLDFSGTDADVQRIVVPGINASSMHGTVMTPSDIHKDIRRMQNYAISGDTERLNQAIEDFHQHLRERITGKYGMIAQMTEYSTPHGLAAKADAFKILGADELFAKLNVDGKVLNEYSTAGINAVFVGEGMFKKAVALDALEGLDGLDIKELTDIIVSNASSGISELGTTHRWPLNYEGSTAATHIFLDKSLQANRLSLSVAAAKAMKSDQDGDILYSQFVRGKAAIYKDGKIEKHVMLTDVALKAINEGTEKHGYSAEFTDPDFIAELQRELKRNAEAQPATIGRVLQARSMQEEAMTHQEAINAVSDIMGRQSFNGVFYNPENSFDPDKDWDSMAEQLQRSSAFQEYYAEAKKAADSQDTAGEIYEAAAKKHLASMPDADRAIYEQIHAYNFYKNILEPAGAMSLSAKSAAGLLDTRLFPFRMAIDVMHEKGILKLEDAESLHDAQSLLQAFMTHVDESFIAAKNATDTETFTSGMQKFDQAIAAYLNLDNRNNPQPFYDFIDSLNPQKEMNKAAFDATKEDLKKSFQMFYDEKGSAIFNKQEYREFMRGFNRGVYANRTKFPLPYDPGNLALEAEQAINEVSGGPIIEFAESNILSSNGATMKATEEAERIITDSTSNISAVEHIADDMGRFANSLMNSISKNKVGIGLGFAALLMGSAYAGGNPTQPADGQAQGIQAQNASYEIPNLMSQYSSPQSFQHNNQSYLININADTEEGQEYVQQAMYSAFQKQPNMSGNINMTMNIKDSSHNLTPSDMLNYITNSL